MKQLLVLLLLGFGLLRGSLLAQDLVTPIQNAAAIAEKQHAEERYRQMTTDVESVLAANLTLQKKVAALENELQRLREDVSRASNNSSTTESLQRLAEKIQEVDRKRESDKDLILAEIAKIGKTLAAPSRPVKKPEITPEVNAGPSKGYEYVIQPGDTLSAVLNDYNTQFKKEGMKTISLTQVKNANPNVNVDRLQVGQKIFIPAPSE